MMRILADDLIVVLLRQAGHDVVYVPEFRPGDSDKNLFVMAREQNRAIVTDDLDFGRLATLELESHPTVILMRLDPLGRAARAKRVVDVIASLGNATQSQLIVIEPAQIRLRTFDRL